MWCSVMLHYDHPSSRATTTRKTNWKMPCEQWNQCRFTCTYCQALSTTPSSIFFCRFNQFCCLLCINLAICQCNKTYMYHRCMYVCAAASLYVTISSWLIFNGSKHLWILRMLAFQFHFMCTSSPLSLSASPWASLVGGGLSRTPVVSWWHWARDT